MLPTLRSFKQVDLSPVFRALGLESLNVWFRGLRSEWRAPETPKKVLTGSMWRTASRNIVHVIPMGVLTALIALNYSTFFIGPSFIQDPEKNTIFLVSIQMCAKLEELFCVASLTAIVLRALRHELLGDGIPIGLLGSGIWFSSLSALWSPEFLSAFSWTWPSWRRARFYGLLLICGLVAATIGPASAILMIPRLQNVLAGGISFYLNGTAEQLWPSTVTAASELPVCAYANATMYGVCPSGGFMSLKNTLSAFDFKGFCTKGSQGFRPLCQARGAEGNRQWDSFLIHTPLNRVPPMLNGLRSRIWASAGATAIQPHSGTVIQMDQLREHWMGAATYQANSRNSRQYRWTYDIQTLGSSTSAFVRTRCTDAQYLSANSEQAMFPSIGPLTWNTKVTDWTRDFKNVNIAQLNRTESEHMRTQWLPLPIETFGDNATGLTTSGLLVEFPWSDASRVALGCAVAASWHDVNVRSIRSTSYGAWSIALSTKDYLDQVDSPDASLRNRPVLLDPTWLSALTPVVPPEPYESPHSCNTLERILDNMRYPDLPGAVRNGWCPDRTPRPDANDADLINGSECEIPGIMEIERIVAMLVVDGLSRFGSHRFFKIDPVLEEWNLFPSVTYNKTRILSKSTEDGQLQTLPSSPPSAWMTVDVVGYAYWPNTRADKLALFGACIYLAVAFSHIVYTLTWKRHVGTSTAWDSVTELLVLCQNSPPPASSRKLENASSGIEQLGTYKAIVKVRAVPTADGLGQPKLRLVLDDDSLPPDVRLDKMRDAHAQSDLESLDMSGGGADGAIYPSESSHDLIQVKAAQPHAEHFAQSDDLQKVQRDRLYS